MEINKKPAIPNPEIESLDTGMNINDLKVVFNECGQAGQCPTLYEGPDGSFYLQGYKPAPEHLDSMPEGFTKVCLPADVFYRMLAELRKQRES